MSARTRVASTVPARRARGFSILKGRTLRVINTHGSQVVDVWSFVGGKADEHMSMEHSRVHTGHPTPIVGTVFYTNHGRPILTMMFDDSGGVHDWLYAACDRYRYELLGHDGHHDNCSDNLKTTLDEADIHCAFVPSPLNLFENVPLISESKMSIRPPLASPGSYVELQAELDQLIILSACPQDMVPTNGQDMTPKDVAIEIF